MPDDALWEGARAVRIEEAEALVPSPELMFIHLAAHAAYHGCSRLLWLYDLARLEGAGKGAMDWPLVARRAGEWGLSLPVTRAIERASSEQEIPLLFLLIFCFLSEHMNPGKIFPICSKPFESFMTDIKKYPLSLSAGKDWTRITSRKKFGNSHWVLG